MTDGRFSGGTYGLVVGHIAPEAQDGGPIAYLRTGDIVTVDQDTKRNFHGRIQKKNLKTQGRNNLATLFTAVVSSVNMPISYHLLHAEP